MLGELHRQEVKYLLNMNDENPQTKDIEIQHGGS